MGIDILKNFFIKEKNTVPNLEIKEEYHYPAIGPFSQVEGIICRDKILSSNPERCGDAIWREPNKKTMCVIDTSAPHEELLYLSEASMVRDLQANLSNIFDGTPLTEKKLLDTLNTVLTSNGREKWWCEEPEFGLSIGGIYFDDDDDSLMTIFNIGTGAVYINNKMEIKNEKEFHNPHPPDKNKYVKSLLPIIKKIPLEKINSITICTDGIDLDNYLPSDKPIEKSIAPGAKEATILKLER